MKRAIIAYKQGFTLIELVVVITIIGLVLAMASIKLSSLSDGIKLKAAAKMIVSDLRLAEEQAESRKIMVEIIFDYNSYSISGAKKEIPKPIRIINPQTVAFAPSGSPIPGFFGTIIVSDGKKSTKIIISPIGRIRSE